MTIILEPSVFSKVPKRDDASFRMCIQLTSIVCIFAPEDDTYNLALLVARTEIKVVISHLQCLSGNFLKKNSITQYHYRWS